MKLFSGVSARFPRIFRTSCVCARRDLCVVLLWAASLYIHPMSSRALLVVFKNRVSA